MSSAPPKNRAEWAAYVAALDTVDLEAFVAEGDRLWAEVHRSFNDAEAKRVEIGRFAVMWLDEGSDSIVRLMRERRTQLTGLDAAFQAACAARDAHYTPEGHRAFVARGGAR